jgi:hypothetical protein
VQEEDAKWLGIWQEQKWNIDGAEPKISPWPCHAIPRSEFPA